MTTKRVWLIRHGLTDWNQQKRWQGHYPTALNEEGQQQAQQLAQYLAPQPIDIVYSSDLPRAYQTAQALANAKQIPLLKDVRLREIHVGVFEGLSPDEIKVQHPDVYQRWHENDWDYALPEGESRRMLQTRMMQAFHDVTQAPYENIALTTHGGSIRIFLQAYFPDDSRVRQYLQIRNTSYTLLERSQDKWQIVELAAAPHLSA